MARFRAWCGRLLAPGLRWVAGRDSKAPMKSTCVLPMLALTLLMAGVRAEDKPADPPANPPVPAVPAEAPVRLESTDVAGLKAALGKPVVVRGKVGKTRAWEGGITFINLAGGFTVVCFKKNLANFPEPPDKTCAGKTIEVSGKLTEHKGKLQIEISKPEQIKVLDEVEPPAQPVPGKE